MLVLVLLLGNGPVDERLVAQRVRVVTDGVLEFAGADNCGRGGCGSRRRRRRVH